MEKIKVLAIGNSFSEDATAQIELFSDKILVRNACIGGCSLEHHVAVARSEEKAYEYEICGRNSLPEKVSLKYALTAEKWDYITVQQVSHLAGIKESYYPHLTELCDYIRKFFDAKIVFHQTWAYEKGSSHPEFYRYDSSQQTMWNAVESVTASICQEEGFSVIKSGEIFARLRENEMFDVERGGISLCRDNFHASLDIGRFALAATWIKFFTGKIPDILKRNDLPEIYKLIKNILED